MPLDGNTYVIARAVGGRPTLMHKLLSRRSDLTACGVKVEGWSRAYSREPIRQVLCKKARCRA